MFRQLDYCRSAHGVQPVPGVDRLGRSPDPPDAGPVLGVDTSGLNLAVHQGEVVQQLYRRGHRQRRRIIAGQSLTGQQRQQWGNMERQYVVLRLAPLVGPTQVVAQQIVEKTLTGGKVLAEFLSYRFAVVIVLDCLSNASPLRLG